MHNLGRNNEAISSCNKGISNLASFTSSAHVLLFLGYQTLAASHLAQNELDAAHKAIKNALLSKGLNKVQGGAAVEYNRLLEIIKEQIMTKKALDKENEKKKFKNAFGKK